MAVAISCYLLALAGTNHKLLHATIARYTFWIRLCRWCYLLLFTVVFYSVIFGTIATLTYISYATMHFGYDNVDFFNRTALFTRKDSYFMASLWTGISYINGSFGHILVGGST
ncbi:hypothetical protein BDF19DRAFT_412988 [Syncephalis fuscata]|nr:hypothetical protein BDF19DRAFT_412988 [Syncephalis fuscata]